MAVFCGQDLQQYMAAKLSTDHAEEPLDCSFPQYAFNKSERYLLRTCMNAATTAGLALALQGATTGLLGALITPMMLSFGLTIGD
jgi:hypothetical protein